MIISGGANIYPAEIESRADHAPGGARRRGVRHPPRRLGRGGEGGGRAGRRTRRPGPSWRPEILAWSKDKLAKFKTPRSIDFVAELPRDPNGKLYKRKLRDPYWADRERAI